MGVIEKYKSKGVTFYRIRDWVTLSNGERKRIRKSKIPTKELAMQQLAKIRVEAFEGRLEKKKDPTLTVRDIWELFEKRYGKPPKPGEPKPPIQYDTWNSDYRRGQYLVNHLGNRKALNLTIEDVDGYRTTRSGETTKRGHPPTPATLDREVELLKRILNYAVDCRRLPFNPIQRAKLLRAPNVRRNVIDEELFQRLFAKCEPALKPIVLVAFDTGMRKSEIVKLRWEQVDLKNGCIRLAAQDTKAEEARLVILSSRVLEMLKSLPRGLPAMAVFPNPKTGQPFNDIGKAWDRAIDKAELEGLWFHDLRRSFVTNARQAGVPESVVMRMSGHKTQSVFGRYNIVQENDLRTAQQHLDQSRGRIWSNFGPSSEEPFLETQRAPAN